jgi:hypothetical protein
MPAAPDRRVRDASRRARANLATRRRQQDRLVVAALAALAARDKARAALEAAEAVIVEATAALTDLGAAGHDIAAIFAIAGQAPPTSRGAANHAADRPAAPPAPAIAGRGEGAVRLWLGMIERGPSPRTHGLARGGGLLCGARAEAVGLGTWTGYAFDVDCQRCARVLADALTEEEFG